MSLLLCATSLTALTQERYKTVIVFSFTKNLEWPGAYRNGPFIISILGNSPIAAEMKQNLQGKTIGTQPIEVRQSANVAGLKHSHIVYIPAMQSNLLNAVNRSIGGQPTLVISEKKGLISEGSDINFFKSGTQLKYEIAPKHIEAKGIRITGSSLLHAGIIYDAPSLRQGPKLESVDDTNMPK